MSISRGQVKYCPRSHASKRPRVACPLVLVDGGASGCGWILSGRRDSLPRAFSQHDHLCKGQENLIWKTVLFIHS